MVECVQQETIITRKDKYEALVSDVSLTASGLTMKGGKTFDCQSNQCILKNFLCIFKCPTSWSKLL